MGVQSNTCQTVYEPYDLEFGNWSFDKAKWRTIDMVTNAQVVFLNGYTCYYILRRTHSFVIWNRNHMVLVSDTFWKKSHLNNFSIVWEVVGNFIRMENMRCYKRVGGTHTLNRRKR